MSDSLEAADESLRHSGVLLYREGREVGGAERRAILSAMLRAASREGGSSPDVGGCPCELVGPCRPECSCVNPYFSGGCDRCCRYGSLEQRMAQAIELASRGRAAAQAGTAPADQAEEYDALVCLYNAGYKAGAARDPSSRPCDRAVADCSERLRAALAVGAPADPNDITMPAHQHGPLATATATASRQRPPLIIDDEACGGAPAAPAPEIGEQCPECGLIWPANCGKRPCVPALHSRALTPAEQAQLDAHWPWTGSKGPGMDWANPNDVIALLRARLGVTGTAGQQPHLDADG